MIELSTEAIAKRKAKRARVNRIFTIVCCVSASISVIVLAILLISILQQGLKYLDLSFIAGLPSRNAEEAGLKPAIVGSIMICAICGIVALPLGVGTAVFLEEYKPKNRILLKLHGIVQLNISNLAGVPSIVYGIIGLTLFVQMFNMMGSTNNPTLQIGADWYDQAADEAGNYLLFPVEGPNAEPIQLETGMVATCDLGDEVTVKVLSSAEIDARYDELDQAMAEIYTEAERRADAAVSRGTNEASEREEKIEAIADELASSRRAELFAGVVAESAYIDRIEDRSWYYFQLPFGRGVVAGGLTLMLVILPIVIVSSQEALRAVPPSLREGSFGLGATKWQAVRRTVLPAAVPGIMTGAILAISRAIGEAAPILILAGIVYITFIPSNLMDDFTAMPLQIYDWAGRPQKEFHQVAASGIIVLLAILLSFNAAAVFIRQKFQKPLS